MIDMIEVLELEKFFAGITIPEVVKINKGVTQLNAPKIVKEKIEMLKAKQLASPVARNYLDALKELKRAILEGE